MIRPAEKSSAVALRIAVTDRCQHRCLYCVPAQGVCKCAHSDILSYEEIVSFVAGVRRSCGVSRVRLTGGDPLARRDVTALVEMLAALDLPDLALTTNGARLGELAGDLKRAGLRRVNVSLDSLRPETFRQLTRGGNMAAVVRGIRAALDCGLHPVRLNMVVLRGVNDGEVAEVARFALELGCEIRFLELMPIGSAAERFSEWFVSSADVKTRLSQSFDLAPLANEADSSSVNFAARSGDGRSGTIGFISSVSDSFCGACRRLRLTPTGLLLGCLARPEGLDLRPILRGPAEARDPALALAAKEALGLKGRERCFAEQRLMVGVGG
jgi:cyclic pyranopterin phosphate synthase